MSYENAPATTMLATHCAVCRRPLVDAESVEKGIGPECRKRHGYDIPVDPERRAAANQLVYQIACGPKFADLAAALTELQLLGFIKLAKVITDRTATIKVETMADGRLLVSTPFTEGSLAAIRAIPGRRAEYVDGVNGNKKFKGNSFPANQKARVWGMIKRHFPGAMGVGPKGGFVVPERQEQNGALLVATVRPSAEEIDAQENAREAHKAAMNASEPGCPHCGCPEYHDGEPCPYN